MAYGGKVDQNLADGGMAQGPSHEEGGIDVVKKGEDKPRAEIEGNERVFSQEDTAAMEQAAAQIIQMKEAGDEQGAQEMATALGFAVVNMIAAQEENQAAQEQGQQMAPEAGMGEPSDEEAMAMNEFMTAPE